MTGSTTQRSGWIPELAGYRALAALAVFGFHLASIDPPGGWAGRLTIPLGNAAVSLFFVLSGFLVYRPFANWALLDHSPVSAWRFIIRRLARILPLYWVVLTVHFLVTDFEQTLGLSEYLTSYLLVQNFRGSMVFLPPFVAWSLCIELWFSIALPLIAAPLRRAGRGRSLVERTQIQLLGLGLLAGSAVVFRVWAAGTRGSGHLLWMPAYLDWFAAGLVLAVLRSFWSVRPPELATRQMAANPWFLSSLGGLSYWSVTQLGLPGGFVTPTPFQIHGQFLLQGLMSCLLVGAAVLPGANLGSVGRLLASRPLQWLGAASYGIYLIHPVVTDELVERFPTTSLCILAPVALVGTLVASGALHRLVEAPASRFADLLVLRRQGSDERPKAVPVKATKPAVLPHTRARRSATPFEIMSRTGVQSLLISVLAFASPLLSLPGRYVGDSRFELTFEPTARLDRMFIGWDSTRGLGRPAEEFWPLLTFISSGLHELGVSPWILQRLIHGSLLALAAVGMVLLARALDPSRAHAPLLAALVYAFGPASSIYLLPIPLYTSYAAAPWLAYAVLRASQQQPLRWAGVTAVVLFLAGNADPPGLLFACVPAATIGLALLATKKQARRRLLGFAFAAVTLTLLASATMITKTAIGSAALSHRLAETESVVAVASASSFGESIRGAGFWLLYFRLAPVSFREHLDAFIANGWVVVATIIPVAVGIAVLSWRSGRARVLAFGWVLIGVVTMVGPFPTQRPTPWGHILLEMFATSDAAFAFRSSHKAGVILAMGTSLLAAWAVHDLATTIGRRNWGRPAVAAAAAATVVVFATITAPFWSTPLYNDALSTAGIPDYWTDAAAQLETEVDGRVLVLPGSTNNGYRWGTVGDDMLDVLVPSPVVATTLPLSTPFPADIVDALDRALTSNDYQPGTLAPIAQRFGITHVVIRNDLAWELQGVTRPSQLDALRGDPALTLIGRHGAPGRFVVNPLDPVADELSLPPIEIYRIDAAPPPTIQVLPDEGRPRTILVDGVGPAFVRLAEEGLLDGGHVVRPAATMETTSDELSDVALVVVTGTTRPIVRRIEYHGYRFAPAPDVDDANQWLDIDGTEDLTTIDLDRATATSSIDPWLLGLDHAPQQAFDNRADTSWLVPRLVQGTPQELSIVFDEPTAIEGTQITLLDDERRLTDLTVRVNGVAVETVRTGATVDLTEESGELATELTIEIGSIGPGVAAVGVIDVRFDIGGTGADPTRLVTRFPAGIASLAAGLPENTPALFLLGPDAPSEKPTTADVVTWSDAPHQLTVTMLTDATAPRCLPLVEIDEETVRMLISPNGDGTATATPCGGRTDVALAPGLHRVIVLPAAGDAVVDVRLTNGDVRLAPVTRTAMDVGARVEAGSIVVLPDSFDRDWITGTSGTPFAADGLTAFVIGADESSTSTSGHQLVAIAHASDGLVGGSLWITAIGLIAAVLAVGFSGAGRPDQADSPQQHRAQRGRLGAIVLFSIGLFCAWLFAGEIAIVGATAAWSINGWWPRSAFATAGVGLVGVAVYRAWPLLTNAAVVIDPGRGDPAMRFLIGMLVMAGAQAVHQSLDRSLNDESR